MGESYFLKRGGAQADMPIALSDYAMICARVPSGCECICAKAGERLSAENVPGLAAFAVPSSGPWTVTITDGTRGKSGLCEISGLGEVRAIQISYSANPAATEAGTILSAQNGLKSGYTIGGSASMSGKAIRESGSGGFWLSPAIDLSSYSLLTVTGYLRAGGTERSRICLGSNSAKVYDPAQTPDMTAMWMGGVNTLYTATLSVSALSGSYYIGSTAVGNNLEITGIILS